MKLITVPACQNIANTADCSDIADILTRNGCMTWLLYAGRRY